MRYVQLISYIIYPQAHWSLSWLPKGERQGTQVTSLMQDYHIETAMDNLEQPNNLTPLINCGMKLKMVKSESSCCEATGLTVPPYCLQIKYMFWFFWFKEKFR